ncbi:hypothetical protein GCM10027169_14490 [Gordonia jinhuaensis]|uniref:Radical SAM core domain-containing protein n=2 Tax=Gordonia jinhuaensis TaxID=1517702 RepID=A0A916SYG0_9ACTN|nr:hypothetical protein GCM10011489_09830 [Gordonia jinhuaensis]
MIGEFGDGGLTPSPAVTVAEGMWFALVTVVRTSRWTRIDYSRDMISRSWAADVTAPVTTVREALDRLRVQGSSALADDDWVALLGSQGDELDELAHLADRARAQVTGETLTYVVNRNLDTPVLAARLDAGVRPGIDELVAEADALGATEICVQGPLPDDAPADGHLRIIEAIAAAAPRIHIHAYRPAEIRDAAARQGRTVEQFLTAARAAGLASVPGTAAQILDDDLRDVLAGGRAALTSAEWIETIETAHRVGLTSTATMVYGHLETPAQVVAHLRTLVDIQSRTGGFTELILMPMVETNTPPAVAPLAKRRPGVRETRAVHAVARLLTAGSFDHLQVAWTKIDPATARAVLAGGADDIGGLLLDGDLMPAAGVEAGYVLTVADIAAIAADLGRAPAQRTTRYEPVDDHRSPVRTGS